MKTKPCPNCGAKMVGPHVALFSSKWIRWIDEIILCRNPRWWECGCGTVEYADYPSMQLPRSFFPWRSEVHRRQWYEANGIAEKRP